MDELQGISTDPITLWRNLEGPELDAALGIRFGQVWATKKSGNTYFHFYVPIDNSSAKSRLDKILTCDARVLCVDADDDRNVFTLERIKIILEEAGTSLDNVLTNTCYLARKEDLSGFNEVYAEYFPSDRPSRTAIIVGFGADDNLVEVTSTACVPN